MSEDEEDPFEAFEEAAEDREGDPFERLDETERAGDGDHYDAHDTTPAGHRDELDDRHDALADEWDDQMHPPPETEPTSQGQDDPFADSDFEYRDEPGVSRGETDPNDEPLAEPAAADVDPFEQFEEMDASGIDAEEVWRDLTDAQARGSVTDAQERTYAAVSKHRYCEQCEFFSAPPDVHCTHEGTEILEFTDMETVRVVDCPIVAERKELEDE